MPKKCYVPSCLNTSDNSSKIFFYLPKNEERRMRWLETVEKPFVKNRNLCFCEEHFQLEKDTSNWQYAATMGVKLILREDAVPHLNLKRLWSDNIESENIKRTKPDANLSSSKDRTIILGYGLSSELHENYHQTTEGNTVIQKNQSAKVLQNQNTPLPSKNENKILKVLLHPNYGLNYSNQEWRRKSYCCKVCQESFSFETLLIIHENTHDIESSHSRPFQPTITKSLNSKKHEINQQKILEERKSEKTFRCKFCPTYWQNKSQLIKHERIHTGEKPFSCSICSKSFAQSSNLNSHMKIHNRRAKETFCCKFCPLDWPNKSQLVMHERIHTGEKPFSCNICSKYFAQISNLSRHMKIHTGEMDFSCNICSKSFAKSVALNGHMKIHNGQRPEKTFCCKFCRKDWPKKSQLVMHERTHTGQKPFSCNICLKYFAQSSNLNRHMNIHSLEEQVP